MAFYLRAFYDESQRAGVVSRGKRCMSWKKVRQVATAKLPTRRFCARYEVERGCVSPVGCFDDLGLCLFLRCKKACCRVFMPAASSDINIFLPFAAVCFYSFDFLMNNCALACLLSIK